MSVLTLMMAVHTYNTPRINYSSTIASKTHTSASSIARHYLDDHVQPNVIWLKHTHLMEHAASSQDHATSSALHSYSTLPMIASMSVIITSQSDNTNQYMTIIAFVYAWLSSYAKYERICYMKSARIHLSPI